MGRGGRLDELADRNFRPEGAVREAVNVGDEGRDVRFGGQYQNQLQTGHFGQSPEQFVQQPACHHIQSDERIVDHQHTCPGQQHPDDLKLAQLAAREHDDRFVQHRTDGQQVVQLVAQGRVALQPAEQFAHARRILVVTRVPALLVVVFAVFGAVVGFVERDIPDAAAREAVLQTAVAEGALAQQGLDQQRFAAAVGTDDGDMFAAVECEVQRRGETTGSFAQNSVFERDDRSRHDF